MQMTRFSDVALELGFVVATLEKLPSLLFRNLGSEHEFSLIKQRGY